MCSTGINLQSILLFAFRITHFLQVFLADDVIARARLTFSTFFLSVHLGHKSQRVRFLGCCLMSVSRPGWRIGFQSYSSTSISWGLNCFRLWTGSAIISIANLSRSKRRRCGFLCRNQDSQRKTRRQQCMVQCPEDSGRTLSANDGIYVGWYIISSYELVNSTHILVGSVVVTDYFIFAFIVVAMRRHENDVPPTFGNVRYQSLFVEESKRTWINRLLLRRRKKRRLCHTAPQYVICRVSQHSIRKSVRMTWRIVCCVISSATVPRFHHLQHNSCCLTHIEMEFALACL